MTKPGKILRRKDVDGLEDVLSRVVGKNFVLTYLDNEENCYLVYGEGITVSEFSMLIHFLQKKVLQDIKEIEKD